MDIFHAIAEPTRRSIVEMLAIKGQVPATEISTRFSQSLPAISQHLKVLREARIVNVRKHGRQRIYELDMNTLYDIEKWTDNLTGLWNKRLDKLDAVLKNKKLIKNIQNNKKQHGKSKRS